MRNVEIFLRDFRQYLNQLCASYDKVWVTRRRKFDSKLMISAIFAQVLNKDSTNYRLIFNHLEAELGSTSTEFSASSFSKARRRFPAEFFVDLSQWIAKYFEIPTAKKWFGYSIFAVDSTKITLPKELEGVIEDEGPQEFDSMHDTDCYYPLGMLTAFYDLQRGMIYDSIFSQHGDERLNAVQLLSGLPNRSLLIGDQGFPSFNFFYEAEKRKVKILMRIPPSQAPEELQDFIEGDLNIATIRLTPSIPNERKALRHGYCPRPVEVRAIKYTIKSSTFILVTTLLDEELTLSDIAGLYHSRWDIEEAFKLSKCGIKLEDFKSKHIDGVLQEIWASQVLSLLGSALSICNIGPKTKMKNRWQTSILGVVKILRNSLIKIIAGREDILGGLISSICRGLRKTKVRVRENRSYPRQSNKRLTPWSLYAEGVSC